MKTDLRFEAKVPNENTEEMEVECESNSAWDERYTLRIPGYRAGDNVVKGDVISLTGAEFDTLAEIVNTFRKMKGIPNGS